MDCFIFLSLNFNIKVQKWWSIRQESPTKIEEKKFFITIQFKYGRIGGVLGRKMMVKNNFFDQIEVIDKQLF